MANTTVINQLINDAAFKRAGFHAAVRSLQRYLAENERYPDSIARTYFDSINATPTAIATAAADVLMVYIESPSTSSTATFVSLYNSVTGSTTAGTSNIFTLLCRGAGTEAWINFAGADAKAIFTTAVSICATTTYNGSTGSSAGDRPSGVVVYAT